MPGFVDVHGVRQFPAAGTGEQCVQVGHRAVVPQESVRTGAAGRQAGIGIAHDDASVVEPVCASAVIAERAQVEHAAAAVQERPIAGPCRVLALVLEDGLYAGAVVGEDLLDGRLYVLRTDRRERRQVVGLQKRVVLAHVWHLGWK